MERNKRQNKKSSHKSNSIHLIHSIIAEDVWLHIVDKMFNQLNNKVTYNLRTHIDKTIEQQLERIYWTQTQNITIDTIIEEIKQNEITKKRI